MDNRVTIRDIAEAAGVSASTVSRIINQKGKYLPETRQAVWDAIQDLKYAPNLAAKSLRSKKSSLVGIFIPTIDSDLFSLLADTLSRELLCCGFSPMVCATYHNPDIELRYGNILRSVNACGIIYVLKESPVQEVCQTLPAVFIGSAPEEYGAGARILFDIIGGARMATKELLNAGCRRIVYIESSRRRRESRIGRFLGYQQALWEGGISLDESLIVRVEDGRDTDVSEVLDGLIEKGISFDGVFSNRSATAIEVVDYLEKHGLKSPEDVKVISFENSRSVETYNPRISAIEMDPIKAGKEAAEIFKCMMENKEISAEPIRVPAILHRRETTFIK